MSKHGQPLPSEKSLGCSLTPGERALIDGFADWVVRKGMTVPAILFFETVKPLDWLAGQLTIAGEPVLDVFFSKAKIDALISLLEDRKNVELLLREIERRDVEVRKERKEAIGREKALKKQMKEARRLAKEKKKYEG